MQVAAALHEYGGSLGVRVLAVYGGQPYGRQINRLKKGVDIVVGTPGRLLDLINKKALDLSEVQTVVLDEADEMLSMGFIEDIEAILNETSPERQTALFSATLPPAIRRLADRYMQAPQAITIKSKQMTVAAIEQRCYLVNHKDKLAALTRLFEVEPITSALIFVRTRVGTGELANELTVRGFNAEALNGDLSQEARERVLRRFRNNQIKVLVATDVAARGLDIDDISHVFNYDLPEDAESYVHRIGRTGRAGKTGIAISLLTPKEQWRLHRIERYVKQKITPSTLPTVEDIHKLREAQLLEQVNVWLQRDRCRRERELVSGLVEDGHDPVEVAAVALKLARAEEKQRPIMEIGKLQESTSRKGKSERKRKSGKNGRKRANGFQEKGMVSLTFDRGRAHGVRPNDVVSTIAYYADIPGHTIGRIHIENQHTLVDVPEQFVGQVLAQAGRYRVRRQPIVLERA
jgi:ATP-dependent RNA helicase DeaD